MDSSHSTNIEIRPITPEEFPLYVRAGMTAFGSHPTEQNSAHWRALVEFDRSLAVFDGPEIVATAGALSFGLTLPGGPTIPVAGVTSVSVLPTHRRRGLLREMMRRQLADVRGRGECMAVLGASESGIYGRFGYGIATSTMNYELDRRDARLLSVSRETGCARLVDHATAAGAYPEVYERFRPGQPGTVTRNETLWEHEILRQPDADQGMSARFYIAYTADDGQVQGIAGYRIKHDWVDGIARSAVQMLGSHFVAATPAARAALWRYCLNLDLTQTVRAVGFAVDEPLRWMLADPRRMRVTSLRDDLYVRLLDIPAALAARRYPAEGRVVFEVTDPFLPDISGRYELRAEPDGAECRRTTAEADLALDVADLGAAYLGGVRYTTLCQAGRVEERTPGAAARSDALFRSDPPPWCGTPF
jgi:predicted acetyltransferase